MKSKLTEPSLKEFKNRDGADQVKILIIDDLKDNLLALEGLLRRDDVDIFKAKSGAEALEFMISHEFALALIDVRMPDMSGFELAELMRGTNQTKNIPIIFVTATAKDQSFLFKGYESGAVDFLLKPLDTHAVKSKVNIFIELYRHKKEQEELLEKFKKTQGEIQLEKRKLEEVIDLEKGLNTIFDANKLFDFIVEKTAKILEADRCSLMLIDEDNGNPVMKGFQGIEESLVIADHSINQNSIARFVGTQGISVLVKDIEADSRFSRKNRLSCKSKSFICAPIKLGDNIIGVINVTDKNSSVDIFSEIDLKIMSMIAQQVAIAIENANLYKELTYLSLTDPLTNMYNFRHFSKSLDCEIERIKRNERNLSLLLIDVDDFKSYNDTFGHLAGDLLLKSIGQVFKDNLRKIDIACRYGGDEFVVILFETDIVKAEIVAEKILKAVGQLSLERTVNLSIGIAAWKKDMDRYDLIAKADVALYEAKKNGKNRIYVLNKIKPQD